MLPPEIAHLFQGVPHQITEGPIRTIEWVGGPALSPIQIPLALAGYHSNRYLPKEDWVLEEARAYLDHLRDWGLIPRKTPNPTWEDLRPIVLWGEVEAYYPIALNRWVQEALNHVRWAVPAPGWKGALPRRSGTTHAAP